MHNIESKMVDDPHRVWSRMLDTIRKSVPMDNFKKWFEPIVPVRIVDSALTIQVPNQFIYEWLEANYLQMLKLCIKKELGDKGRLEYQILVEDYQTASPGKSPLTRDGERNETYANIANPFVIPGIKKVKADSNLNPNYTFDNFIEGSCNRVARQAGLHICQRPGHMFNPLVIYGNVGLGKTHLAQAIGNGILKNFPNRNIVYTNAEKFTTQFITAVRNNATSEFSNFYNALDGIIIDDIQFFAGKAATQEIFFHLFNQMHQSGKQIVLTIDRPPKDLQDIEDRLVSRFKWGLAADLTVPDFETKMAILASKIEKDKLELSSQIMEFICNNIKSNIRELEGVLVSLIAHSSLNFKKIDLELAKEVVQSFVNQINSHITVESVIQIVAEQYKIPMERITGTGRHRQIVMARQLAMYFAKKYTDKSLKHIGQYFGGKDHTTVLYSCNTAKDLMDTDLNFRQIAESIEKKLSKQARYK